MRDLVSGETYLVSKADEGEDGAGPSGTGAYGVGLSEDGNVVAYSSEATNLDPGDTVDDRDIYVNQWVTDDTALASTSSSGEKRARLRSPLRSAGVRKVRLGPPTRGDEILAYTEGSAGASTIQVALACARSSPSSPRSAVPAKRLRPSEPSDHPTTTNA